MPLPSPEEMRSMIEQHVENWNAGDKEAWLAGLARLVRGDFSMEDPVGTPVKHGWDVMSEAWDASPNADWKLTIEQLFVCGNEVATLMRSDGVVQGQPVSVLGIEVLQFREDGSAHWKTYMQLPDGSEYAEWTSRTGN
jgi:hypothetical protein